MTQYAILIYEPGDPDWSALDTEEKRQTMAEYGAFGQTVAAVLRGGAALYPTTTATTVRQERGERRAVRRDQGGPDRLLPARVRRPRRGGAAREPCSGGPQRLRRGPAGDRLRCRRRLTPPRAARPWSPCSATRARAPWPRSAGSSARCR